MMVQLLRLSTPRADIRAAVPRKLKKKTASFKKVLNLPFQRRKAPL
jgi:hypothetical protein